MKKRAMKKDFWMEIKKSRGRFLSIFLIVALGVSFFSGIRAAEPDMRLSGDAYFDEQNLMDLKVLGTLGITEEDLEEIEALSTVEKVEGGYSIDVLCNVGERQKVLHVMSMLPTMNSIVVEEGRLPKTKEECLVDVDFLTANGYKIGDQIHLESGRVEEDLSESLKADTYTIVGSGSSPCYISFGRGSTQIGTGEISGFLAVMPEAFAMDVYTEAYVAVKGAEEETAFTDGYEKKVDCAEKDIEKIQDLRCEARYEEVTGEAKEKLAEAKEELADGKVETAGELAKAAQKIADGEKELQDGSGRLADGQKALKAARELLITKQKELDKGRETYESGLAQYEAGRREYEAKKAEFYEQLPGLEQEIAAGEAELEAKLAEARAQLDEQWANYEKLDNVIKDTKAALEELQKKLEEAKEEETAAWLLEQMKKMLPQMKESLAKLQEQIVIKQQELWQIERELEDISQARSIVSDEIVGLDKKLAALYEERNALEQAGEMIPEELLSEIASQEAALAQKQSELQMWEAKFVEGKAREKAVKKELDSLEPSAVFLKEQIDLVTNAKPEDLEEIGKVIAGLQEEIKKLQEFLEEKGDLSAFREQLEAGEAELAAQAEAGRAQLASARQQLEEGEAAIIAAGNKLDTSKKELDTAYRTITSGQQQINAGWKALRENEQTLKDAKASLTAGEEELALGKGEYEDGKQKAEEKFREAEEEIAKAEKEIEEIVEPEWYLMTRDSLTEYGGYGDNAARMRAIGKVFPVLFFLVAALISLTTMTRMVEEQRTQIGTLKALGYSKLEIAGKYLNYALLASVGGSIVGVLFGEKVFPFIIVYAYKIMYKHIPHIVIPYHLSYGVMATLAAVACTFLATLISCYRELASTPAVLMRPPAPKEGKRILLERITFLWKHFSFIWKSTFRNLIRYKKRFFMTIFGIGGCMALMLVGFGLKDSIYCILDLQYQEVQEYDGAVYLKENASPSGKEALLDYLNDNDAIGQTAELYMKMITVEHGKEIQEPYLTVVKNKEEFEKLVHFRNRLTGETYEIQDDGVMLSEKLASMLEVERGDTITIVNEERGNREVKVTDICENYLGHYIYMSGAYYKELYGEEAVYNCFYFDQKEYNEAKLQKIGEDVLAYPDVLNISYVDTMRAQMDDMLRSLNLVIVVLIISAGALAFIVLYNLNNINITERQRELATLKVLGFYDKEVGAYVYRENILLTIIGAFVGCGLGWLLHRYVIVTVEVEEVMFGRQIDFSSFVYSFLFTVGFSLIVNFVMYFKLKKIDMVESLKSVE